MRTGELIFIVVLCITVLVPFKVSTHDTGLSVDLFWMTAQLQYWWNTWTFKISDEGIRICAVQRIL